MYTEYCQFDLPHIFRTLQVEELYLAEQICPVIAQEDSGNSRLIFYFMKQDMDLNENSDQAVP